ncbi:MAG: hypothetical protein RLZZ488_2091 [Pseudomonadota bacterium]|jgi:acetyltransferase-like isoleucine patch superfamily enzyme
MELNHTSNQYRRSDGERFSRLVKIAFREHLFRVPSMVRNFAMFSLTHFVLQVSGLHRGSVRCGKNVRIQRIRALSTTGARARIFLGDHSIVFENARLEALGEGEIHVGDCSIIGDCRISSRLRVSIGRRCLTSWNVFIQDHDSHPLDPIVRAEQVKRMCRRFYPRFGSERIESDETLLARWTPACAPVLIGDDVWIGANTTILKGARIGSGSTIASGSTVLAGEYPPRSVLAGNPARVVRVIPEDGVVT